MQNLNFLGLTMGQMAAYFDFRNPRSMENTQVKTPFIISYTKLMNSNVVTKEITVLMKNMLQKIVVGIKAGEESLQSNKVTLIGVGMVGAALATLIAKENGNNVLFVDEGNTKNLEFFRGENCVFIKDEIVNGLKTIDIIDRAQKLGHQTLGIFTIMNENLPLTQERFNGISSVEKVKISHACPMYSLLTPQSIYKSLYKGGEAEIAENYQKMMNFTVEMPTAAKEE